jgi:7-carboxy-7-deazaguanine synthase
MGLDQIHAWLQDFPEVMVEITGGEPLLQEAVYPLLNQLITEGREILLETSGSLTIERVPSEVSIILDVKTPDSGMADQNFWENFVLLKQRQQAGSRDEVKFVLCSPEDVAWAVDIVRQYELAELMPVLFSPVVDRLAPDVLAELILQEQLPVRLQLQLHTQIWPNISRGV